MKAVCKVLVGLVIFGAIIAEIAHGQAVEEQDAERVVALCIQFGQAQAQKYPVNPELVEQSIIGCIDHETSNP